MKSQTTLFFATKMDFLQLIDEVEIIIDLDYYRAGHHPTETIDPLQSLRDIEHLGMLQNTDWMGSPRYIVIPRLEPIYSRPIHRNTGEIVYAMDMLYNPDCVVIKLSGICTEIEKTMLVGSLGIRSDDKTVIKIFNTYNRIIKKMFTKIGRAYVGPESLVLLKDGWRLTQIASSPIEYDLRIE